MDLKDVPEIQAPTFDNDDERLTEFAGSACDLIESHLTANLNTAQSLSAAMDVSESVEDVIAYDNIDQLQIRAQKLENPRVTLWLKECPTWANDAWTETFHPFGLNAYNGKVKATFDVRPY